MAEFHWWRGALLKAAYYFLHDVQMEVFLAPPWCSGHVTFDTASVRSMQTESSDGQLGIISLQFYLS